jgi:3-hydroxyisobutyrate dehydrogenase-like beta-hydroxyacid dehydrogenase
MIRSVAVIGIGEMGAPIARRIARAGFSLTVCDRDEGRLAPFARDGARTTQAPKDCASCDAVLILVSNEGQLRAVTTGISGLAVGIDSTSRPIVLVGSTVSVGMMRELSTTLSVLVLDTPVSGGPARAESGNLTVLAGGNLGALEAVTPLLESFADNIFICGPPGAGQMVKIINNVICTANIMLMAEGYRIALNHGLDLKQITAALEVSTGRNFLTAGPKSVPEVMADYTADRTTFEAILSILRKDSTLGAHMTEAGGSDFPVMQSLASAVAGLGDETWRTWSELGAQARKLA